MADQKQLVHVINGPNLNLLGTRQPEIYGTDSLSDLESHLLIWADKLNLEITMMQTNHEGAIIDALHGAAGSLGVVLNPGAYAHTSRAIADAISSIGVPVVEVHISNIKHREAWRAVSLLEDVVTRSFYGRGFTGYRDAMRLLVNLQTPAQLVQYGPHPENIADLRHPDDATKAVMLIHGGFWMQEWTRDSMDSIAVDLHRRGVATLNIEYRRTNAGGAWPGSGEDVWLAHNYLTRRSELAGLPITVLGHSAGGYLALHLGQRNDVGRVVALAPLTSLELQAGIDGPGREPAKELLAAGAPASLSADGAWLFHGLDDELVPTEHSSGCAAAFVKTMDGAGHFDLLNPAHPAWQEVLGVIDVS